MYITKRKMLITILEYINRHKTNLSQMLLNGFVIVMLTILILNLTLKQCIEQWLIKIPKYKEIFVIFIILQCSQLGTSFTKYRQQAHHHLAAKMFLSIIM